ncbi:MAG: methylated-DNA--[protein]-cysteine S-methyltransferase [Lachnospiraceae bacterium]|nr:methylated-DNA--[protein]-cysteine S-methyltransferase [Lachnospiraceae bacterium]
MNHKCHLQTPIGIICIQEEEETITALYDDRQYEERYHLCRSDGELSFLEEPETELLKTAGTQLIEYFQGKRKEFSLPLSPQGTEFQKKVWEALCTIPYGQTRSYGEIATQIGNPKACRAVGGANNKNPIMIFIPCHRVIGADGSLVGFGGGLRAKRYMLDLEKGEN